MQSFSQDSPVQSTHSSALEQRLSRWIQQLKSEDLDLLNETVQHLTQHAEAATPLLIKAIMGAEDEIRKNAVWVLGFIRRPESVHPLFKVMSTDSNTDVCLGAAWALRQFGASVLAPIVFNKLPKPQNMDEIRAYMLSKSWKARWFCTVFLTYAQHNDCLDLLLDLARQDESVLVRCSAILALSSYSDPRVTEELCALLQGMDPYVKIEACTVLSLKNDPSAVPALGKQLDAYNENVRVAAIAAIGTISTDPGAVLSFLAKALKDESDLVRINGAMALYDISLRFQKHHQNLADLSLKALRDSNVYVVKNAARCLGLVGDEEAMRQIINQLKQEAQPAITANLVQALGMFQDPRAYKILAKMIRHQSWEVRFEAVNALSQLKTQRSQIYGLFIQALKDPALLVKEQAIRALGALGNNKAIGPLEKMKLQHPYGVVNKSISEALDKLLGI